MTGFGRTGRWFGVDHWGVVPDMMTLAKGLTSAYLPLGAVAMNERVKAISARTCLRRADLQRLSYAPGRRAGKPACVPSG